MLKKMSPWGWGSWARVWQQFETDPNILFEKINSNKAIKAVFNHHGYNHLEELRKHIDNPRDRWFARFWASNLLNGNHYSISLNQSLVRHIGLSGLHFKSSNPWHPKHGRIVSNRAISQVNFNDIKVVVDDQEINDAIERMYKVNALPRGLKRSIQQIQMTLWGS